MFRFKPVYWIDLPSVLLRAFNRDTTTLKIPTNLVEVQDLLNKNASLDYLNDFEVLEEEE